MASREPIVARASRIDSPTSTLCHNRTILIDHLPSGTRSDDMVNNEVATDWFDLQRRLFDFPLDLAINRFRTSFVFRGLANGDHEQMTTSLMRLRGDYALKERSLLRNFQKYAYLDVAGGNSMWHWLAMGQHYGLPTRLLDWSFSPYVALHFATANLDRMETDGVIWCVDLDETNESLPDELSVILRRESAHVFTAEMLLEAAMTLEDLDRLPGEFALWLEPPSLDARIVNQFALFSLMSSPTALFDRWLEEHSRTACRIVIPAELKWEVRDKLDQANITERVIFPGLAGLSAWLRRHYYTR
jgi:hypothetical protein